MPGLSPDRQQELAERERAFAGRDRGNERSYGPAGSVTPEGQQATRNIYSAVDDYNNVGNSFLDNVGNFLGRAFGVAEQDPLTDPNFDPYRQSQANYSFSPVGLLSGIAGTALGLPGLGTAVGFLDDLVGRPLGISLRQSAFDPGAPIRPEQRGSIAAALANLRDDSNRA